MLLVGVVVAVVVNAVADVVAVVDDVIKDDLMVVIVVIVKFIEFDDVVLLSELDESDSTETRHDKAEDNVGEGM